MSENVKISDLVELNTLSDADELPVVDADQSATKRVRYDTLSQQVLDDITDLAELSSLAVGDELAVFDADANATKRVTYDTLATEVRTESEPLSGTTGTFSGDITSNGETVYHRGNVLGTVSQSGGDPTGAVIERDSNSNGEYVRYADGTQICWRFVSNFPSGLENTFSYPVNFASQNNLSGGYGIANGTGVPSTAASRSDAYLRFLNSGWRCYATAWNGLKIQLFAVGRWY